MEEVLEVIEQARESYLSKDGQLKVIYDAYSKYKRNVEFVPSALVASEEAREAAQQSVRRTDEQVMPRHNHIYIDGYCACGCFINRR